ncbi:MAG: FAD-dependent oxidoreductase [Opitutus sp.]|nr:FAD-dependent oxidoreductase [Opitutus sp.]MCS6247025.1 FAD-dependent oxidoreductase [Opitutus sp.]MCS6273301.1 FAD-dependent oxidoreductase [Opitutus sp.]MCS6278628.1 FAD-dependent oxidoreductase [Opitutus sp.]MCS6298499.1 FAD-dependent oxidoreductase [Opitutus sp.]
MSKSHYDLCVVGAGSGGIGAALAGARAGLSVLLVEKSDTLGGNAVRGGVHNWEPGVGGTDFPYEIYRRLRAIPGAVTITKMGRHCCAPAPGKPAYPGGEVLPDPLARYADSLQRHSLKELSLLEKFGPQTLFRAVVFEPHAYSSVVGEMLAETGNCTILMETAFRDVCVQEGRITSLVLDNGDVVKASFYVDGTADAKLCQAAGCTLMRGQEGREAFGEPDAPEQPSSKVNAVTLIYRVKPRDEVAIDPLPPDVPSDCWWQARFPASLNSSYPNGDLNINMLPTMQGEEFLRLGYPAAYTECRRRVLAHWHYLQTRPDFPEFQRYTISWIAPALGVRETVRVVGEYVLTQYDLMAGLSRQEHPDIITIADHALDRHGDSGGCVELKEPYGVPYRCLLPKGINNLLVACRGASFSSIAASSCRLSRTMMALGHAAGTACALAKEKSLSLREVPASELRRCLRKEHVELEWPRPIVETERLINSQAQSVEKPLYV